MQEPQSPRRRRVLAGIGAGIVATGVGTATTAAQDQNVTVTLDNVGVDAWEVTAVEGSDGVAETGTENPTLTLQDGVRYTFENNGWSSHPLAFLAADGSALLSQSDDGSFEGDSAVNWVDEDETVSFTLTSELADELAGYTCTVHSSMEGAIEVGASQDDTATATFSDQSTDGTSVVVDSVNLPEGGFVTIHDSRLTDGQAVLSVRGTSAYLEAGNHEDIEVELDDPLVEGDTLIAMPHRDTNGNETYDFVSSQGEEDGPYTADGNAVVDDADVQVDGDAAVLMSDQRTAGQSVVVDFVRMADGGFVTIHDSSLLDGETIPSVVGVSDYLEPGANEAIEVEFDEPLTEDDTLIAMPHRDTNDNETYDFVETGGEEDGPYTADGDVVLDDASVTVGAPADVSFADQESDGSGVTVDSARLDDGGFIVIHDSSLMDGEPLASVIGVSEYFESGEYEDIQIEFDEELTADETLIAMAHRDTNDNQTYDFSETGGAEDGPYVFQEAAVIDDASVTIADGGMDDEMDDGAADDGGMDNGTDDDGSGDDADSADDGGPGFGPIAGITGLGGLATYAYRRLDLDTEPPTPADDGLDGGAEE
jgi:hypothetical protein